jgi:hypothetical protein
MMHSIKGRGGLTRGRGLTETVRSLWVNTAHHMADVDMAMSSLLGLNADDGEHVEVGGTRVRRDYRDMQVMLNWLKDNDPFDVSNNKLRSLFTGVTAGESDCVNCDTADEIGLVIHEKMDNKVFYDVKLTKVDQVRTLNYLNDKTVSKKALVTGEANNLFHRLLILAEHSQDVASYFSHEMTTVPTA